MDHSTLKEKQNKTTNKGGYFVLYSKEKRNKCYSKACWKRKTRSSVHILHNQSNIVYTNKMQHSGSVLPSQKNILFIANVSAALGQSSVDSLPALGGNNHVPEDVQVLILCCK